MRKVLLVASLLFSFTAFAQPDDPGDNPDVAVPIDGGVTMLVAAGTLYGIKKFKESRNRNEEK